MSTILIYKKTNPMSTVELRSRIDDFLNQVDENFLKVVHAMLETQIENQAEEIVGYRPGGGAITVSDLEESIRISEEQIARGECYTIEEVRKAAEGWLSTK